MDISDPGESSRKSSASSVFTDPELTPKPLRIFKRESQGPSGSLQTQHNVVPKRRLSLPSNTAQLDLLQRDPAISTSKWTRRNAFLNVPKQRRSVPNGTSKIVDNFTPKIFVGSPFSHPPAMPRDRCAAMMIDPGSSVDEAKAKNAIRPASTRAFSTEVFKRSNLPSPLIVGQFVPSEQSSSVGGRPRSVTASEVYHSNADGGGILLNPEIRREPSFKHRLMSRVMSGLTNRTNVKDPTARRVNQHRRISQITTCPTSPIDEDPEGVRRSFSSVETDSSCCGSDLDRVLATFPTPPTSRDTTPTTAGSFKTSCSQPPRHRNLRIPEDPAVMGPEICLTPEYDQLRSKNGNNMLVAIDIQRDMSTKGSGHNLWSQNTGLDIVVIIDNSVSTSPATLLASCETARFLASILDTVADRMAILCTSPLDVHGCKSKVISPLRHIKTRDLKLILDEIVSSTQEPDIRAIGDAIQLARQLLMGSTIPDPNQERLQDTFGHIFVFSADDDHLPHELLEHEKIQLHILCPGSVPRKGQCSSNCNGWKARSISDYEPQAVSATKDADPMSLFNRLRTLITHARSGKLQGTVSDLVLDIEAGSHCSIEGLMGRTEISTLHAGEIISVLVKLRVQASAARGYSFSRPFPPTKTSPHSNSNDIFGELDRMLGTSAIKILTARLRYKHSLLPVNTTCSISADCRLKKQMPSPAKRTSSRVLAMQPTESKILVQKRLAYHLATQWPPRHALSTLRLKFGSTGCQSFCPDYIRLILKELEYHARVTERYDIYGSPTKLIALPDAGSPRSPVDAFGEGIADVENYKPGVGNLDVPHVGNEILEEVQWPTSPKLERADTCLRRIDDTDNGEARRIWSDLRKMSSPTDSRKGRIASSKSEEERQGTLKCIALRNQRSMGAETLRSISSPTISGSGKGFGAPWL